MKEKIRYCTKCGAKIKSSHEENEKKNTSKKIKYPDEIIGHKVIMREFTEKNLYDPIYLKWLKDPLVVDRMGRAELLKPFDFSILEDYFHEIKSSGNKMFFSINTKEDDQFIGTFKLTINWNERIAEIGTLIGEKEFWGKGLFQDSAYTISKYAFDKLNMRKVTGGCFARNLPAIHAMEKIGFQREALFRKSVLNQDSIIFGVFKEELRWEREHKEKNVKK